MPSYSIQPRRQRKALYTAHAQERHRRMTVPLSRELRAKYKRRNIPLRKGDTVRIISGSYVGQEQRVAKVHRRGYSVTLDNVTGKTAEAKLKPLPVRLSHLVITKLNLSDPWRRRVLHVTAEEAAEPVPEAETTVVEESAVAEPTTEPEPEPAPKVEAEPAEPAEGSPEPTSEEPTATPPAAPKKPRRRKAAKSEE